MAPPSKGSKTSSTDHIRAFNVAAAGYRALPSERSLADLEKILAVLTKITDVSVFDVAGVPEVGLLLLNCSHILELLDYKSNIVWEVVSLLTVACNNGQNSGAQLEHRYQFLPILARLLHSIPATTHKRTLKLLLLIQILAQDLEILRREAYLSSLITDLIGFTTAEDREMKCAAVTILALLARKNYVASRLIHSLYPEDMLSNLLNQDQAEEDPRLGLAVECFSFHVFHQISVCGEVPRLHTLQEILCMMRTTLSTAYSADNHLLLKFVRDFLRDIRGNAKWLGVLQDVDSVDLLSEILLIPDFTASFSVHTAEMMFSFLEEFALIYLKDNLVVFNLIFKVVLARLDAKPNNEVSACLHLLNTCILSLNIDGMGDADSRNLKFQVDQLLPCLQNIFLDSKSSPTTRLARNRGEEAAAVPVISPSQLASYSACLQLLNTLAREAAFTPHLAETIKASKMNTAFRQYYSSTASQQEATGGISNSRLAVNFLCLAATMAAAGPAVAAADNSWQKVLAESLGDVDLMRSVAVVLKKEGVADGALYKSALDILSLQKTPEMFFDPSASCRADNRPSPPSLRAEEVGRLISGEQTKRLDALLENVTNSLSRMEVMDGDEGVRVLADIANFHAFSRDRERGQMDSLRKALEAADVQIHAQNAAMVEQEARLLEANRLLALVSSRYSAAREEFVDLRQQHSEVSREADTTRNKLTDQLIASRKDNTKLEQDNARLCDKYGKSKAKTEQLTKDLELYKQNEEQLQERLRGEQRTREELGTVLAKKDEKLKKTMKQLEEELAKRERLEKRVEELVKQNSSLETLSKGQEQALTKKEKQLQDAIEEMAEMKRIQDAIFNLSKSRQTAGSCS